MSKPKYQPGDVVASLDQLMILLGEDGGVYLNGKWTHKGWLMSMRFMTVLYFLKRNAIRVALPYEGGSPDITS